MHSSLNSLNVHFRDVNNLLHETKEYIPQENRQNFEIGVARTLEDCIKDLSKEASTHSDGELIKINVKWRRISMSLTKSRRGLTLFAPLNEQHFEATLMWMSEQGLEQELNLIQEVKEQLPYNSKKIERLLKTAEFQINARISEQHHKLKNYVSKTINFIAKR